MDRHSRQIGERGLDRTRRARDDAGDLDAVGRLNERRVKIAAAKSVAHEPEFHDMPIRFRVQFPGGAFAPPIAGHCQAGTANSGWVFAPVM